MLKFTAIIATFIATACSVEDPPAPAPTSTSTAWIVWTEAACNGTAVHDSQRLCLNADPRRDLYIAGDHAADDFVSLWKGACSATQGLIGTVNENKACTAPNTLDPAPWLCDAGADPTFEACQ